MFFGGGFPGFEHPGHSREVDNTEYYKLLGVNKDANSAEIKKAYRKLAIKHHPDKGGDPETFKKISEAYDVLGTPEKKELYDKYGKEGVEQGGGMSSAEDVFSRFFGGGERQRERGPKKGKSMVLEVKVTLEDLYQGKKKKFAITRNRAVYPEGMTAAEAVAKCSPCQGQGRVTQMRRVGPGMIQQVQMACDKCNGKGSQYKKGVETKKVKKVLEVYIEPGMYDGKKIVFSGEADESPGILAGDVIFVLKEQQHEFFQRKGADLLMEKTISLRMSLTGFSFPVRHVEGKTLIIKRKEGEITAPNALLAVPDQGMPIHKRPFEHGRLFIFFKVEFPESVSENECALLRSALKANTLDDVETIEGVSEVETAEHLIKMTPEDIGKVKATMDGGEAYDSDEDEDDRRGVQCQQS